jgi:hypothetical protein
MASRRVGVSDERADCGKHQHSLRSKGESVSAGHGCDENVQREPQQKRPLRKCENQPGLDSRSLLSTVTHNCAFDEVDGYAGFRDSRNIHRLGEHRQRRTAVTR